MWLLSLYRGINVIRRLVFNAILILILPVTLLASSRATLLDLENHVQKYTGLSALLSDPEGLQKYRDLLKSYMGYGDDFDPIFDATIEQMRLLSREVPGFSERLWTPSLQERIEIEGSRSQRSGVEVNNRLADQVLIKVRASYRDRVKHLLPLPKEERFSELKRLEEELLKDLKNLNERYPALVTKRELTGGEQRQLKKDKALSSQRKEYFQTKRELLESSEFLTYLRYELSGAEIWLDIYRQKFAESSVEALTRLSRLDGSVSDWLTTQLERELSPEIGEALQAHSGQWLQEVRRQLEVVLQAKKKINALVTPREPPELVAEIAQIQQQNPGIQPQQAFEKLSERGHELAQEFSNNRSKIYDQKKSILREAEAGSFFQLPVVDEQDKLNLELRRQTSETFVLAPMRGIHSAFGGLLVKECVGGACVENLTPRRWALAALEGSRVFAAERDGKFDGILRLVPTTLSTQSYENVDMMIRSISDTIEIQSEVTGESAKYSLFDAILDHLQPHHSSSGFLAGDGHAISQNTGLAKVYQNSPSVLQAELIESKDRIGVRDQEMETAINLHFPNSPHGYNPGGMVYEGMPGDGKKLYVLRARSQRPRLTQEDLEVMIIKEVLLGRSPLESAAWALAVENDIKLPKRLDYYTEFESSAIYRAIEELRATHDEQNEKFLLDKLKKHPALATKFAEVITSLIRSENLDLVGAIFNSRPQLIKDLPQQWEELRLKLFERIRSDDYWNFEQLENFLIENSILSENLTEHLLLLLQIDGEEIKAVDGLRVLARLFVRRPDLIEKLEPVWEKFVNKTGEILRSADLETLKRLAYLFIDDQAVRERLGPLWQELDEKIAQAIHSDHSDRSGPTFLGDLLDLLFDSPDRPDNLPNTLMALIQVSDQGFLKALAREFRDDEAYLAERMPDHFEAFIESNRVLAHKHFEYMLEDLGYSSESAFDHFYRLVRSTNPAVLNALSSSFSSNLEAAEIFWANMIDSLDMSDRRRSLVALFRHSGLRQIFTPFLERTPEAELPVELHELARREGHRVARVRLSEMTQFESDSESPRTLKESFSMPKSCGKLLRQLHLKILAP